MSQASETGRPGRYTRSANGLIGSMIVLVLVVTGVVLFRGAFRETPEYVPEPIDYLSLVESVQRGDFTPVYPPSLPEGWFVKEATFEPGDRPVFDLAIYADGRFAGVHQEDRSVDELVDTYVGGDAVEGDEVTVSGSVTPTWQTFSDPGGDHAFAAEVDGQTVLVYGTAPEDELLALVEALTTAPVS